MFSSYCERTKAGTIRQASQFLTSSNWGRLVSFRFHGFKQQQFNFIRFMICNYFRSFSLFFCGTCASSSPEKLEEKLILFRGNEKITDNISHLSNVSPKKSNLFSFLSFFQFSSLTLRHPESNFSIFHQPFALHSI